MGSHVGPLIETQSPNKSRAMFSVALCLRPNAAHDEAFFHVFGHMLQRIYVEAHCEHAFDEASHSSRTSPHARGHERSHSGATGSILWRKGYAHGC